MSCLKESCRCDVFVCSFKESDPTAYLPVLQKEAIVSLKDEVTRPTHSVQNLSVCMGVLKIKQNKNLE